jgi:hypothetical protein
MPPIDWPTKEALLIFKAPIKAENLFSITQYNKKSGTLA